MEGILRLHEHEGSLKIKAKSVQIPKSRTNGWQASWKKFLIDMMYLRGYVSLYPNFPNQMSFSTNHMEPGAHIAAKNNVVKHNKADFEVPLIKEDFKNLLPNGKLPPASKLPSLNLFNQPVSLKGLKTAGAKLSDVLQCSLTEIVAVHHDTAFLPNKSKTLKAVSGSPPFPSSIRENPSAQPDLAFRHVKLALKLEDAQELVSANARTFKRSNDSARLVITTIMGMVFGYFVGISFPSVSLTRYVSSNACMVLVACYEPYFPENLGSGSTPLAQDICPNKSSWWESLPPGIVVSESDFYLRRLWGEPSEDLAKNRST
ncbi:hypothetical protein HAX54_026453 [Datura stramonium]|uniref:Uncharacterized protein n=1 Tax=Datura stramonium TaxID=4076 RepID=A0ABS8V2A2_DATST|nr:hypothetical protein [Datura stramonium]